MELEVAPFSVADELESLVDMFAAQSVGSNIDLVLDLSGMAICRAEFVSGRIIEIKFSDDLENYGDRSKK